MRRLVAVLLLCVVLPGCDRGGPPPPPAGPSFAAADAATLLGDSWVSDGDRGYFVDGAGLPGGPAFSLYDTRWRLALATDPARTLDPAAVRRWAGHRIAAGPDGSGLPDIAQLDAAVQILRLTGAPVDPAAVARRLAGLRHGWGYRAAGTATGAEWGSTAVALRLSGQLGLAAPGPITAEVRAALADPARLRTPSAAVSVLESAAALHGAGVPPPVLAAVSRSVQDVLDRSGRDTAWLSLTASLHRANAALGLPAPSRPARCGSLIGPDGEVRLPGAEDADPQSTAAALEIGCAGVRRPAPGAHSRAGWPAPAAVRGALAASAAGLAVADATGFAGSYRAQLVRQARTVWLPAAAGGTGVAATVDRVNLKLLARALGDDVAAEVSGALPAPAPVGTAGADPSLLLVLAEHRADPAAPPGTLEAWLEPVLSRPDPAAAIRVAWLSAAADVLDRPDLRARARTVLTRLGAGRGVYAATVGGKPSLTASVIAAGVVAPAESSEDLVAAGLCDRSGCAEEPGPAGGWSLRPLAYYLRTPFPVAF